MNMNKKIKNFLITILVLCIGIDTKIYSYKKYDRSKMIVSTPMAMKGRGGISGITGSTGATGTTGATGIGATGATGATGSLSSAYLSANLLTNGGTTVTSGSNVTLAAIEQSGFSNDGATFTVGVTGKYLVMYTHWMSIAGLELEKNGSAMFQAQNVTVDSVIFDAPVTAVQRSTQQILTLNAGDTIRIRNSSGGSVISYGIYLHILLITT